MCRWLERTDISVDRVILWGGLIPADVDLAASPALRAARLTIVAGTADEHATPELLAAQDARLAAHGIQCERVTFNGSHRIDRATLARVAVEGAAAR